MTDEERERERCRDEERERERCRWEGVQEQRLKDHSRRLSRMEHAGAAAVGMVLVAVVRTALKAVGIL
ncbi:MAG: hypothetical protein GY767_17890 [Shimia sp.]|nr:hypothetical protein [Shimia sp.]